MKYRGCAVAIPQAAGRSPCGERGLKLRGYTAPPGMCGSLPVRGAWIEIATTFPPVEIVPRRSPCGERGLKSAARQSSGARPPRSLPVRGAWIEMTHGLKSATGQTSLPVRGAWIEITSPTIIASAHRVSLPVRGAWIEIAIALVKSHKKQSLPVRGAWIEIAGRWRALLAAGASLPVRGAWIEIAGCWRALAGRWVAPRAGSVD